MSREDCVKYFADSMKKASEICEKNMVTVRDGENQYVECAGEKCPLWVDITKEDFSANDCAFAHPHFWKETEVVVQIRI